jgi:hypothetical protein
MIPICNGFDNEIYGVVFHMYNIVIYLFFGRIICYRVLES